MRKIKITNYDYEKKKKQYTIFLDFGKTKRFTSKKAILEYLVQTSKKLNTITQAFNNVYQSILQTAQTFIFHLDYAEARLYKEQKHNFDEHLYRLLGFIDREAYWYIKSVYNLGTFLSNIVTLLLNSKFIKQLNFVHTFKAYELQVESLMSEVRNIGEIQLKPVHFNDELEYLHISKFKQAI